ncbi:hypothetical protein T265_01384 [Opisthorchis viverrini]|uniref:Uncharacterized protein n=1 Tax=Opisthorchis viverrini TaxID=6198 RepID=A0A075AIZ7_OPIVI|nr:hypothetical protein T265_01384 [Opisthorchis viverrini]KER32504.1 hypothetical protein T265_01384 [Opisthorchis viverrini]
MSSLKREKVLNLNGLYPALFKEYGGSLVEHPTKLIWKEELTMPTGIPIFKEGRRMLCVNHYGISPLAKASKVLSGLISVLHEDASIISSLSEIIGICVLEVYLCTQSKNMNPNFTQTTTVRGTSNLCFLQDNDLNPTVTTITLSTRLVGLKNPVACGTDDRCISRGQHLSIPTTELAFSLCGVDLMHDVVGDGSNRNLDSDITELQCESHACPSAHKKYSTEQED